NKSERALKLKKAIVMSNFFNGIIFQKIMGVVLLLLSFLGLFYFVVELFVCSIIFKFCIEKNYKLLSTLI
ncbi:MAG: hypothetical protein M3Z87_12435, partial [Lactobacillus sp.]|nr:hypothetical protein [Lactobacillus sp.]